MTQTGLPSTRQHLTVTEGDRRGEVVYEPFDSEFFELAIGRVLVPTGSPEPLLRALSTAAADAGYDQLLRRVPAWAFAEIWALESVGFRMMDVGVTFARSVDGFRPGPPPGDVLVEAATAADVEHLLETMVDVPWGSRYEADPTYGRSAVQRLQSTWLRNSLQGRADHVLVGRLDGAPVGYVTCRLVEEEGEPIGEIDLVGTVPAARGRGVASAIVHAALGWFAEHVSRVTVRTQVTNHTAAGVYERAGMTLHQSDMTFRLALTERGGRP